ncbi:MAG: hypothetical protein ACJ8DI_12125 [Ktedonobacteraceae bacterium]
MQTHSLMHGFASRQISFIDHKTGHEQASDAHRHRQSDNQEENNVQTAI